MLNIDDLPTLYTSWRSRQSDRDVRHSLMDAVLGGDLSVYDPDEEQMPLRSPNFILVAAEDTAEAGSILPTVRVTPTKDTAKMREQAEKMERIAMSYLESSDWTRRIHQTILETATLGLSAWMIWPDSEGAPRLVPRDPRTCYPQLGHMTGDEVKACIFARNVKMDSLSAEDMDKLRSNPRMPAGALRVVSTGSVAIARGAIYDEDTSVLLCEYVDREEYVVAALWGTAKNSPSGSNYIPTELSRVQHGMGVCPVVISDRLTFDNQFRGQFDQVIGIMHSHHRLFGMLLDYADQAVYSDIWVKDLIGDMPWGGGGIIELGPNGAIGRVAPAASSFDVQRDLEHLEEGFHFGARYPKSRPGEIDQSIASAKFLESSMGVMNTAIRTYHAALMRSLKRALYLMFKIDKTVMPGTKRACGVLRNQQFLIEYDVNDIDLDFEIGVDYGIGFGRDPAQTAVISIQLKGNEALSLESMLEGIEGITDVAKELRRIDVGKFQAMIFADLMQKASEKQLPPDVLVKLHRGRENGKSLVDLYDEFVVRPAEEAQGAGVMTGLQGLLGAGTGQPVPGGAPGGAVPPMQAPDPASLLARLAVPAGDNGSFLGSDVRQGGPA